METERLVIDRIRASDKEDYFKCISHDKKVLETFICRYAETMEEFDFSRYLGRDRDVIYYEISGGPRPDRREK